MSAQDVLEIAAIIGVVVGVWFLFLGWKLRTPPRARFGRRGS